MRVLAMSSPYSIREGRFGSYRTQTLTNDGTGESAVVVRDFGAQLQDLRLSDPRGRLVDVIMGHASPEDMCRLPYMGGTTPLIPFANYVTRGRYSFLGEERARTSCRSPSPDGLLME